MGTDLFFSNKAFLCERDIMAGSGLSASGVIPVPDSNISLLALTDILTGVSTLSFSSCWTVFRFLVTFSNVLLGLGGPWLTPGVTN